MFRRLSNQFLQSTCRNQWFLKRSSPEVFGSSLWFQSVTTQSEKSAASQNFVADGKFGDRVFASYSIFKGKAALSSRPVLPSFSKSNSGGLKVDRRGTIMLTFWPAIGERKYNWEKKQAFALSATEVGALINLGPHSSVEFFHDPSMKSSNAGQVRKSLSIKAQPDGSGYLFSLNVVNNILQTNERFVVPVTAAEFEVMRTAFSIMLFAAQPSPQKTKSEVIEKKYLFVEVAKFPSDDKRGCSTERTTTRGHICVKCLSIMSETLVSSFPSILFGDWDVPKKI